MVDPTKNYKTRLNREVRIYATDANSKFPVHGAVFWQGQWEIHKWCANGTHNDDELLDLFEVKPRIKREIWVNVYPEMKGYSTHSSRAEADRYAAGNRIACVKVVVDCEEGEGL